MRHVFLLLFVVTILISAFASAATFGFTKSTVNGVIVKELNNPATYEFQIINYGPDDNFEFYNYLGFRISPVGTFPVASGETKNITVSFYPSKDFASSGNYEIEYFIMGTKSGDFARDNVMMRVIPLSDLFEVGSDNIEGNSSTIKVYIHNKEAIELDNVNVDFSSAFFNQHENFSIGRNEKKEFDIQLNKDDYKKLIAGSYTLAADININGQTTTEKATINFVENQNVVTTEKSSGFFINNLVITKSNEGNVVSNAEISVDKNIVTRLFTTFSPQPDSVERNGFIVHYLWAKNLNPSEELGVTVKTNWLFPLLLVAIIICVVWLTMALSKTHVVIRKRVNFVRIKGKGGEFALKVSIFVQANNFVERVNVNDRIPNMMKIYGQFGGEKPASVDEKNGRIVWRFENLDKGEIRVMSYVIYSKLGVLGKFALPLAKVVFEKNGEVSEVQSNKAYFVTDQISKEE